jgi:DNA segregation ATPase FtsK/SpoIIIE-like protein
LESKQRNKRPGDTVQPPEKRIDKPLGLFLVFAAIILTFSFVVAFEDSYVFTDRQGFDLAVAIFLATSGYVGRHILLTTGLSAFGLSFFLLAVGINQVRTKQGAMKRAMGLSLLLFFSTLMTGGLVDGRFDLPLGGLGGRWGKILATNLSHSTDQWVVVSIAALLWLLLIWHLFRMDAGRLFAALRRGGSHLKAPARKDEPDSRHQGQVVPHPADEIASKTKAPGTADPDPSTVAEVCRAGLKQVPKYKKPSLEGIIHSHGSGTYEEIDPEIAERLDTALSEHGISAEVSQIHPGPVVSRFDLELKRGQRIRDVRGATEDLSLAVGSAVRLVETPEAGVVGLEVPNTKRQAVRISDIFREMTGAESRGQGLNVPIGVSTSGEPFWTDLNKMPHLLIAGTTGSGKSVFLSSLILSMVYLYSPSHTRLALIDPKVVELSVFEDLPHLIHPVITEVNEAGDLLSWLVQEMENRYQRLAKAGTRDIKAYQGKKETEKGSMPFIVVIIDEFADLFMAGKGELEEVVIRLAQKSRAVGIHLILATQRPSVKIVTGLIKANFPSRIAFNVVSATDSRIILDEGGAESLLGNGDMLTKFPDHQGLLRLHGAFVDEAEIEDAVSHLKA